MEKSLFCVVQRSDGAHFLNNKKAIHLLDRIYQKFKDSIYFVPTTLMKSSLNLPEKSLFVPVSFPESQLFMAREFTKRIHLINDDHGRKRYGNAAYFVPLLLYRKLMAEFEQELSEVVN